MPARGVYAQAAGKSEPPAATLGTALQTTIKTPVTFTGIGLHSGAAVRMTVHPASVHYGVWFRRSDLEGDALIPAQWYAVSDPTLCTRIRNDAGAEVQTIEHIMAALAGCGVHNALIEIDGPEVPVLDGSSTQFVEALLKAGLRQLDAPVRAIEILEPVEVRDGAAWARLEPADSLSIEFHIDFADAAIGRQTKALNMANGAFVRELCDSRTFCRQQDIDNMHARGLALGGSLGNAVVVQGDRIVTPGGLRHGDEAVRHKMLDAMGDLALAGAPVLGCYTGHRAGHALTNRLLRQLFATPSAFRSIECSGDLAGHLPGVGVRLADVPALT